MKNLLGDDVSEDKYFESKNDLAKRETLKDKFRKQYGFKDGCYCKDCDFFGSYTQQRTWYKCQMLGFSHSTATDIRKSDIACNLYQSTESAPQPTETNKGE